jgi:peptide/nickel transport system permease protein
MLTYIIRRLLISLPILFGITVVSFLIIHLAPGTPYPGIELNPRVSPEVRRLMEKTYHFDKPLVVRYGLVMRDMITGRIRSFQDNRPVLAKIGERLPASISLEIVATILTLAGAIPLGVYAARHRGTWRDQGVTILSFMGIALPSFWVAYMLLMLFVGRLHIPVVGLRTFGMVAPDPLVSVSDRLWHLFLPALIFAIGGIAAESRYMRGSMTETMVQDFVRTARAKGLPEEQVVYKHALRNALLPMITIFGLMLPGLLGGAVIVETIFAYPGIGRLAYEAVMARDYPTIMTLNTITAVLVLLGNLLADVLYAVVDPRIRYE